MTVISLENVGLVFHVRRHGRISLKEYLLHGFFRRRKENSFEVRALEGIDLRIGEGERVGIIGPNGAGKSTLLKLLAGIYPPASGQCTVRGKISSLFELSLGFEPDASGWDNIRYRSYLQGETPRSIRAKMDDIAAFSELGQFLDMSIRYYSSGMLVRLAFAIATVIEPEDPAAGRSAGRRRRRLPDQGPAADAQPHLFRPRRHHRQPRPVDDRDALRAGAVVGSRPDPHGRPGGKSDRRLLPAPPRTGTIAGGVVPRLRPPAAAMKILHIRRAGHSRRQGGAVRPLPRFTRLLHRVLPP